ncbi:hypothetical protein ACFL5P_03320 [candidate division KSB1 bacterium]
MNIDKYIIMSNHLHGIITIENNVGAPPCGRPTTNDPWEALQNKGGQALQTDSGQAQGPAPMVERLSLGDIAGRFKSFSMRQYTLGMQNNQWKSFKLGNR